MKSSYVDEPPRLALYVAIVRPGATKLTTVAVDVVSPQLLLYPVSVLPGWNQLFVAPARWYLLPPCVNWFRAMPHRLRGAPRSIARLPAFPTDG